MIGKGNIGFSEDSDQQTSASHSLVRNQLKDRFSQPLMNRLDRVCVFNPANTETLKQIVKKELDEIHSRLQERQSALLFSDAVLAHLAEQIDLKRGGHGVRRAIETHVESLLTDVLLSSPQAPAISLSKSPSGDLAASLCDKGVSAV
jgi:ATP-dependent Clp protease ATP-binding subunit ClpA